MSRSTPAGPTSTSRPPSRIPSTRPGTAMTRPGTAMGGRASTIQGHDLGEWVCAVIQGQGESRGRLVHDTWELMRVIEAGGMDIGIASYCLTTGKTVLTQLSDAPTFPKTIHHLSLHPPSILIMPDVSLSTTTVCEQGLASTKSRWKPTSKANVSTLLVQTIENATEVEVLGVPRKCWNQQAGLNFIVEHVIEDHQRAGVVLAASDKYYALCAAAALFKHIQTSQEVMFAKKSMKMSYEAAEGTMLIDHETAKNLELVNNALHYKSNQSLFGLLNRTSTKMAARLLKSTILQPSTVPQIVENRLDTVQELIQSEEIYSSLKAGLKPFNKADLDALIAQLSQTSTRRDPRNIENRIAQLLRLRETIRALPTLIEGLSFAHSALLKSARETLADERCEKIDDLIDECLNQDACATKGKAQNVKATRIYSVRANFNKMLDVARETYKENIEDIHQLRQAYHDKYDLDVELHYREQGFSMLIKGDCVREDELPREFRNVQNKNGRYHFMTADLSKLNARMRDSQEEVFLMSDQIISELREAVVEHISCLYGISDAMSKIDMLLSFAEVSKTHRYIRPEFTGTLAIKNGRHPVLDKKLPLGQCIGNDTYAAENECCFQLIQGANMSGKSTYLRQVGLLTVMAMIGCFVPATYASFRFQDSLLSRLSNDDSIEKSLSTFAVEMATSSMILGLATKNSLVLIDELGRGTAPIEGMGLAHAIAEALIRSKAFVFFTTHFKELATTLAVYPTVEILHLHSQTRGEASAAFSTSFAYKVVKGPCKDKHYGLELAKLAALPDDVMEHAEWVAKKLSGMEASGIAASETKAIAARRKALLTLRSQLKQVVTFSTLPDLDLRDYLRTLQAQCAGSLMVAIQQREEVLKAQETSGVLQEEHGSQKTG